MSREEGVLQMSSGSADMPREEFDAFIDLLDREIDERLPSARQAVVYYVPRGSSTGNALQRKRIGDVLSRHKDKLRRTTASFSLITESPLVKSALSAIFWLAPPPYPYKVCSTIEEALAFAREHNPQLDASHQARKLRERHRRATGGERP